jgi:hypothetical protein
MAFMLKGQEGPLLSFYLAQEDAVGADLRLSVLGPNDTIVDLVVDEVGLDSPGVWRVEGEQFRQRGLDARLDIFKIDPEE